MAFSYSDIETIKSNIEANTDKLESVLNQFNSIVQENVNNPQVWKGKSSADFMTRWNDYSTEKFPQYKAAFNKEIDNVTVSLSSYREAENM